MSLAWVDLAWTTSRTDRRNQSWVERVRVRFELGGRGHVRATARRPIFTKMTRRNEVVERRGHIKSIVSKPSQRSEIGSHDMCRKNIQKHQTERTSNNNNKQSISLWRRPCRSQNYQPSSSFRSRSNGSRGNGFVNRSASCAVASTFLTFIFESGAWSCSRNQCTLTS